MIVTSADLRANRQRQLTVAETRERQCTSGELRWLASASRSDARARLAQVDNRMKAIRVCGLFACPILSELQSLTTETALTFSADWGVEDSCLVGWSNAAYFVAPLPSSVGTRQLLHWPLHFSRRTVKNSAYCWGICEFRGAVGRGGRLLGFILDRALALCWW